MMFCRKCGTEVAEGQQACPKCGGTNIIIPGAVQPGTGPAAGGGRPQARITDDGPVGRSTTPTPVRPSLDDGPRPSGMALASMVLGLLGLVSCGVTALFGLVFGLIGLAQTSSRPQELSGRHIALGGTITSGAVLLIFGAIAVVGTAMMATIASQFGFGGDSSDASFDEEVGVMMHDTCISNQRQMATALQMYAQDHQDMFPPAGSQFKDTLAEYWDGEEPFFDCPYSATEGTIERPDFAMNQQLYGLRMAEVSAPNATVLLGDSDSPLLSTESDLARNRHGEEGCAIAFVDGHVDDLLPDDTISLIVQRGVAPPPATAPAPETGTEQPY